jgi:putative membrane protein
MRLTNTSRNSRILAVLYAFAVLGAFLNAVGASHVSLAFLTPVTMALLGIVSLLLTYEFSAKSIGAMGGVVILLFFCQALGVNTGFPFGEFAYTSGLGPKVLDVPLVMPFAWLSVLVPAWVSAGRVLRYRNVVVASIIVTAVDAVFEFTADSLDLWHWKGGLPTELNYVSWFGVSCLAFTILEKYATEKEPNPIVPHFLFAQLLYFALTDAALRFLVLR